LPEIAANAGDVSVAKSERNRVKLRIHDQDYVVISPAAPEHLKGLARQVDESIREFTEREPRMNITKAAVLTAMVYLDKALAEEKKVREQAEEIAMLMEECARLQREVNRGV
jgi:cell division protein ZapA